MAIYRPDSTSNKTIRIATKASNPSQYPVHRQLNSRKGLLLVRATRDFEYALTQ